MPASFKLATFNVENLFSRAKVFNFRDHSVADTILGNVEEFRRLLKKEVYTAADKAKIMELYTGVLKPYIEVTEDRGKLFKKRGWAVVGVAADGVGDWDGTVEFKRAEWSEIARTNTAKVIKDVRADVACIVEAEGLPALKSFDSELLKSMYRYHMLIEANDPRGIDVGLYSTYELGALWTHMFDKEGQSTIFSRDCLEVEVILPGDQRLYVLCNHFKSRGYDADGTADEKRTRQAAQVAKILRDKYDLASQWVVVAGDLNDNPERAPLRSLLDVPNLYDVLALQFPNTPMKRWTYHYDQFEQIDYILVSAPLQQRFHRAGVERRGIHRLNALTTSSGGMVDIEKEYNSVTHWTNAASDHGAVWAEFDL